MWRRTHNNNLLRPQSIENADDTLAECCAPHNAVIDNHQIINTGTQTTVGNIIHMGRQVIATVAFGNKGTQFDIFDSHLFAADTPGKYKFQFLHVRIMPQRGYLPYFLFIEIVVQPFEHSIKRHFGRIGNKGKNRMVKVIIDRFQNTRD